VCMFERERERERERISSLQDFISKNYVLGCSQEFQKQINLNLKPVTVNLILLTVLVLMMVREMGIC